MSANNPSPPIEEEINDPGNEDPGSVWPIQQEPNQHPHIDEDEQIYEQGDVD